MPGWALASPLLLLASVVAAGFGRRQNFSTDNLTWQVLVRWSPVISLLAVMTQSNVSALARILTPYYLLLLPALLAGGGQALLVTKSWWRAAAFAVFFMAAGLLIISPARPLFPASAILEKLAARDADSQILVRMKEVYSVYRQPQRCLCARRATRCRRA